MIRFRPFRDLSLARKLLLPYLVLLLVVGAGGTFTVVRALAERAEATLQQQLARDLLEAQSVVRERELYVLESATFAANVRGIPERVRARDTAAVGRSLASVLALKTDIDLLVATDPAGTGVAEFVRRGGSLRSGVGTRWDSSPVVRAAMSSTTGAATAGLLRFGSDTYLAVAVPVCTGSARCDSAGVALAGVTVTRVAQAATGPGRSVGLYAATGARLAATGDAPAAAPRPQREGQVLVVRSRTSSREVATMMAPLEVQGRNVGTITTTVPTADAFAAVRGAAYRLALLVLLAMAGIVAIGALLSRVILTQVRELVRTHRRLGAGDLSARAAPGGADELGEVAQGLNRMAEQLEASVTALESQVEQRTSEVRRLLSQRTEFFAGLSHEFRTPLAVVLARANLLLDTDARRTRADRESLLAVQESARQALALVNAFLDLARADADRLDVALAPVDLAAIVRGLDRTIHGLGGAADVRVVVEVPDDLPRVRGDAARLREVVLNLVDNAIKYTASGGSVAVRATATRNDVVVEVSDTGIGIPSQARDRLFEPFYRVPGNQTQYGQPSTGLGLALTKRLVDAHGGTIVVDSEVGRGTTFRVTLPRLSEEEQPISTCPISEQTPPRTYSRCADRAASSGGRRGATARAGTPR